MHMPTSSRWQLSRPSPTSRDGMVAAKTPGAVDAGTAMLQRGGNAIDAAVATAFASGVAEPWMNGVGGGGFLVAWIEKEQRSIAIEFPMISPSGATEDMFPLAGRGVDSALFGWPTVKDQANVVGHRSVAIPGTVDGLALALERYGTRSLAEVLQPAIALARDGVPVSWHTTYMIGRDAITLSRFPATAGIFLGNNGFAPSTVDASNPTMLRQPDLAATLEGIANNGSRWFYEGEIAQAITGHLAEHGGTHAADDFARYHASETTPRDISYRDTIVTTVGGPSGGSSLSQIVRALNRLDIAASGHNTTQAIHHISQLYRRAYADRFSYFGDPDHIDVPFDALLCDDYIDEMVAELTEGPAGKPRAATKERLGVTHDLAPSVSEYMKDGSTTHLSTADSAGNVVAITQTLLSAWGSRVVAPGTGVLLNNGMMWFDPEPGRPNSVAGRKRPLANMAPVVIRRGNSAIATLGSSGGRKISYCNTQLIMNLIDHGLGMQDAIEAPRFDTSTPNLNISDRISQETRKELSELGHQIVPIDESLLLGSFASPVGIARDGDGLLTGGVDPWYFPATAGAPPLTKTGSR